LIIHAFRQPRHTEGADGKVARCEIAIHLWELGAEVAFVDGWSYKPWARRFDYIRCMLVWWHVIIGRSPNAKEAT